MRQKLTIVLTLLIFTLGAQAWAAESEKKEDDGGDAAVAHYNKGIDLLHEGDWAAAAKAFKKALKLDDEFAEAHNNLGYALRRQGEENYEAALKHYNRALELDSNLAEAYMYRGVLHVLSGDEEKARRDLEKLNELDRELGDQLLQVIASGEEPSGQAGVAAKWDE